LDIEKDKVFNRKKRRDLREGRKEDQNRALLI